MKINQLLNISYFLPIYIIASSGTMSTVRAKAIVLLKYPSMTEMSSKDLFDMADDLGLHAPPKGTKLDVSLMIQEKLGWHKEQSHK